MSGFLFYYLGVYFLHLHSLEIAILSSLIFGLAHFYQGWREVAKTAIGGVILAGLYLFTNSLLLPMIVHALLDLQVSLIFWPASLGASTQQKAWNSE